MVYDPMAVAVDWLDAYRAADLDGILAMYAEGAVVQCECDGETIVGGQAGLRAFWRERMQRSPASDLDGLTLSGESVLISYLTPRGIVHARLSFNEAGQIAGCVCSPGQPALRRCG